MKRLAALLALLFVIGSQTAQGEGFLQTAACYLSGSNTACLKTINVASGGTGAATLTTNSLVLAQGTSAFTVVAADTTTTHVLHGGTPPTFGAVVAGDLPTAAAGVAGIISSSGNQTVSPRLSAGNSKVSAYHNGASQSVTCAVTTELTLDTEDYDTNSEFASSRFTATHAGYYLVNLDCDGGGSASTSFQCSIYKNGTGGTRLCSTSSGPAVGSANNEWQLGCSTMILLNGTTDYIDGAVTVTGTGCLYYGNASGSRITISEVL